MNVERVPLRRLLCSSEKPKKRSEMNYARESDVKWGRTNGEYIRYTAINNRTVCLIMLYF